jgi:hypothetical protein
MQASSSSSSSSSECRASECSLLCEDFARLGFDRVVVDAGVQVAYDWGLAREMMSGEHLNELYEGDVLRAGACVSTTCRKASSHA